MGRFQLSLRRLMLIVLACVLLALVGSLVQFERSVATASQCVGNFSQIGLALHIYHSDHGCFPPAYIADAKGRPMHSWRVLLLPYLEQQDLYAAYNFNEPWNGPNNSKLAPLIPKQFICPNSQGVSLTNLVAVVGPHTAFPGAKSSSLGDIIDGPANTVLLVEATEASINWMEPRDLAFDELRPGISSEDHGGAAMLFADGRVRRISLTTPMDSMRGWLTIDGHEPISIP